MHKPVLLKEVLNFSGEIQPKRILDGTFGRGGHTSELLELPSKPTVTALDQDLEAIAYGEEKFREQINGARLQLRHGSFHDLKSALGADGENFDIILLDLGVSSPQLDVAERGFSFYHDGPLDMRMNREQATSAADIVNDWPEVELLRIFREYGEVRRPDRVVRAIVQDRKTERFRSTRQLAGLIERVEGWKRKGHHPATTYFLALRMAVNNELEGLSQALPDLMRALTPGGRLLVITFHSLEDRIIKYAFKESDLGIPLFKKVIVPTREEQQENPRARSAKLRIFQRGSGNEDEPQYATDAGD